MAFDTTEVRWYDAMEAGEGLSYYGSPVLTSAMAVPDATEAEEGEGAACGRRCRLHLPWYCHSVAQAIPEAERVDAMVDPGTNAP
eukprot:1790885-Rhodomonas_salina.2